MTVGSRIALPKSSRSAMVTVAPSVWLALTVSGLTTIDDMPGDNVPGTKVTEVVPTSTPSAYTVMSMTWEKVLFRIVE